MKHTMNLNHSPFAVMKSGQKDVELRLYDEKRSKILAGDEIEFTDTQTGEKLLVQVQAVKVFSDFAALYRHYDKLRMGYGPEETADPADMKAFYPAEKQAKYGVAAIEIQLI